jgi:NAD(P)-dependent dehydrogenase (short-subunit alcohol dehydrogenase family)
MTAKERPVALITGVARGIGAATAARFLASGEYDVVGADVLEAKIEGVDFARCDVSSEREVAGLVRKTIDRYGRIDVLLNVAGVVLVKPLTDTTWDDFQRIVNINLGGTWLTCKHALPHMKERRRGAIVNMASVSGHVGQVDHALYGATKGAVIAFTRALAWEVAPFGIRVNSISPGSVDTPMLRSDIELEARKLDRPFAEIKATREAEQALGRWAEPAEIAESAWFLAGDTASFITGTDLLVDGGWVAR